jgi:hypothetical protein
MLQDILCMICKENIGRDNKNMMSLTIERHLFEHHHVVWEEVRDAKDKMLALYKQQSNIGNIIYKKYGILLNIYRDGYEGDAPRLPGKVTE